MDGVKTLANAVIAQTPMSGFVGDARRVHVVCYAYEARAGRLYPPEEVVARALSRIGHKRYDLLYDNCESCTLEVHGSSSLSPAFLDYWFRFSVCRCLRSLVVAACDCGSGDSVCGVLVQGLSERPVCATIPPPLPDALTNVRFGGAIGSLRLALLRVRRVAPSTPPVMPPQSPAGPRPVGRCPNKRKAPSWAWSLELAASRWAAASLAASSPPCACTSSGTAAATGRRRGWRLTAPGRPREAPTQGAAWGRAA